MHRRPDQTVRHWGGSTAWHPAAWAPHRLADPGGAELPAAGGRAAPAPGGSLMGERPITLTSEDAIRLRHVAARSRRQRAGADHAALARLAQELDRASIVESDCISPDVATMNSTIRALDMRTRERMTFTIAWPEEADAEQGRINVLAPLGMALLGCRTGDVVSWNTPGGGRRLRVEAILFQPESRRRAAPAPGGIR